MSQEDLTIHQDELTIKQHVGKAQGARAAQFIRDEWHLDLGEFLGITEDGVTVEGYGATDGLIFVTLVGNISREQLDRLRHILWGDA
jgi:hypothetical protein